MTVADPLYSDAELEALGLTAHHPGATVDAAVVQADQAVYRSLTPESPPGIRTLVDGRRVTDPALWAGAPGA